jgi:hypothetical protein
VVALAQGRHEYGIPAIAADLPRIEAIARRFDVRYAYAGYWFSNSVTWQSSLALHVAPVADCEHDGQRGLCPYVWGVVTSWYRPKRGARSLLLEAHDDVFVRGLPEALGPPVRTFTLASATLYLFDYDIASRFLPPLHPS